MKASRIEHLVLVCYGSDCKKAGAKGLRAAARKTTRDLGMHKRCLVARSKCLGQCKRSPVVCLQPANVWLEEASERDVERALAAVAG